MSQKDHLAYIVGKIMGDGHLEKTLGSCFFIDGHKKNLYHLRKFLFQEMKVSPKSISIQKNMNSRGLSYRLRVNSTSFCKLLYSAGAPSGNKTSQKFDIPCWIYSDQKTAKSFLQAILEDELTTIKIESGNHSVAIQFKMSKHKSLLSDHITFMQSVKLLIESFSVSCGPVRYFKSKEKDKFEVYFRIQRNKSNILRFQQKIGFKLNEEKLKSLERCCIVLEKTLKAKPNTEQILALNISGKSIREISSFTKVSRTAVHRILKKV